MFKINWNNLINLRMYLFNYDTLETDVCNGFRINKEHLKRVMEAKSNMK